MNEYISYEELKDWGLGEQSSISTRTEELLAFACQAASRMFDGSTRRKFYPWSETRYFDFPPNDSVLKLDEDLLAVSEFTTNNDDTTITSTDYYLMCGRSYNLTPYDRIVLKLSGTQPNLLYSGTPQKSQKIAGTWGYHEDWPNAWEDTGDTVQDDPLTAVATTVTVSSVAGQGLYEMSPRFRAQDMLKIESEYLYVISTNPTADTLSVRRGVNGTTAAAHVSTTAISVYRPMDEIALATKTLAKWIYDRRQTSPEDEMGSIRMGGILRIPSAAPASVKMIARRFRRLEVG